VRSIRSSGVFGYQPEFLEKLGQHYAQSPMGRSETAPHYQQREISLFKLLSPHVCRVLAISDALDIRALRSEMLERTLDGLVAGVFLTARDGRVVYMNAAAERQIKAGNSIRIVNNRVFPADPAARAALPKAIDEAARDDIDGDMSEHSLAIPDVDGGPGYVATLLPVARGQRRDIVAPFAASVAVLLMLIPEAACLQIATTRPVGDGTGAIAIWVGVRFTCQDYATHPQSRRHGQRMAGRERRISAGYDERARAARLEGGAPTAATASSVR
jgi:hypothetical protein